ncbi:MAG: helix-turn-helix transcriptional regulator [Spirochaetales bacterium]|uniref:Helix-turn-helix transcriptional regulator n=1 Tax=Candidatus Thalassospirochaeta sargassi TaxID=3119039 RepID=A0AAJ1IB62_9SPIO|nr:helix-turn-helix transcriptional regulator [Spirochaetales bacterium]
MQQLILWFNILAFTFLFASMGATYIVYSKLKPKWLVYYLLYLASYAFFTVFNTYDFFSRVYLPAMPPFLYFIAVAVTYLIALALLVIVPRFVFSLFTQNRNSKQSVFIMVMVSISIALMVADFLSPELPIERAGSIFMNAYLGGVTLYGIIRLRKTNDKSNLGVVLLFLRLSCIFYSVVVLQSILLPLFTEPVQEFNITLFTAGLICFLWGSITLAYLIIKNFRQENIGTVTLTDEAVSFFGITPREKEIINLLLCGKSNNEIGEKLFVSTRTVEAHVYNIYRKCSVKNKLELARKLSSTL